MEIMGTIKQYLSDAITLRVLEYKTMRLMSKGIYLFDDYHTEAEKVYKKLVAFQTRLKKNPQYKAINVKQFKLLLADDTGLLGEFLVRWKEKGTLKKVFVAGSKYNVSVSFGIIKKSVNLCHRF